MRAQRNGPSRGIGLGPSSGTDTGGAAGTILKCRCRSDVPTQACWNSHFCGFRCWRQAEAAWQEAEATEEPVTRQKRKGQASNSASATRRHAWARVERALEEADRWERPWQRARAALAIFRPEGILNDRTWAEGQIAAALKDLQGPQWKKVHNFLTVRRALVFLDCMHARLEQAVADPALRRVCVRRWWLRHGARPEQPAATPLDRVRAQLDAQVRAHANRVAEPVGCALEAAAAGNGLAGRATDHAMKRRGGPGRRRRSRRRAAARLLDGANRRK